MREVAIIGVGMTPVGEHWDSGLRELGAEAVRMALDDAGVGEVSALYVGNAFGGTFSSQTQVGALVADHAGLSGVEAFSVDAGDASGGAALRTGYLAVASGLVDTVIVAGVEKSTDAIGSYRLSARSTSLDADYESIHGATLTAQAALIMRRYMHEYGVDVSAFEGFSINAHRNGRLNPNAMFRNALKEGAFGKASMVADPVNLFDGAPDADGSAAVVLTTLERALDRVPQPVKIIGSAVATDSFALQDRADVLHFRAVELSMKRALQQAGVSLEDIDLIELHDAYTIFSTLSLEAGGFSERGAGWQFATAAGAAIGLNGNLPISTFGGLKSRGNPVGATGVYQAVEAVRQLRGTAGDNQVEGAKVACIQNLGGIAVTAVTHLLALA